jgi:hypothetical protein
LSARIRSAASVGVAGLVFLFVACGGVNNSPPRHAGNGGTAPDGPRLDQSDPLLASASPKTEPVKGAPKPDPQAEARAAAEAKAKADAAAMAQEEADRDEAEMVKFEIAAGEDHADTMLRLALRLETEAFDGPGADRRYRAIIKDFPDTQAAADATQLLKGFKVPERPKPPYPILPAAIVKTDPHPVLGTYQPPPDAKPDPKPDQGQATVSRSNPLPQPTGSLKSPPSSGDKTVFVRGYTRKDGTHVDSHYRSPPHHR